MHPIERLRYVARAGDADPAMLAVEAAEALGSLAFDPRALVPACRRLIDAHPSCGPLWWVAARILVATDARAAAQTASDLLLGDPTAEELAATFPAGATVIIPPRSLLANAVALRPDLTVYVVGTPYRVRHALARIGDAVDAVGIDPGYAEEALEVANLVVLQAIAASTPGVLVEVEEHELASQAVARGIDLWVATSEGTVLPPALFEALRGRLGAAGDDDLVEEAFDDEYFVAPGRTSPRRPQHRVELVEAPLLRAVVGPTGTDGAHEALRRADCAAPLELLATARG